MKLLQRSQNQSLATMKSIAAAVLFLLCNTAAANDAALRGFDPRTISEKEQQCIPTPGVEFMSQCKEDRIIFEKFFSKPLKCGGTVLEIGGFDGKTYSNSWFYEVSACDDKGFLAR